MGDWQKLKRLGRYLLDKPMVVVRFRRQNWNGEIVVWSDSDYAGCKRTRKSTSGGVIMLGEHTIKSWSNTQAVIALSSGEAEYYAMVKASSVAIGTREIMRDLGIPTSGIRVKTDATAAKGIASRSGLGKVRHIEVSQLWLQEKVADGKICIEKR